MSFYRNKLLQAVLYFAKHIKRLNSTKLLKLLYFLDMDHFKQTGYPSIGLSYYAYEHGPVPVEFWKELITVPIPHDLDELIRVIEVHFGDVIESNERQITIKKGVKPDVTIFTPREIEIMNKFVMIFKDYPANTFSEASHELGSPWAITRREKGDKSLIDYMLAIDERAEVDKEEAEENLKEYFSLMYNFQLRPTF